MSAIIGQSRFWELQSFAWTPGQAQSLVFDVRSLPVNHRVTGFLLAIDLTVTDEGGGTARPEDVVGLLLDYLEHTSEFFQLRATGYTLARLLHAMTGKTLGNAAIAATGAARACVWIPLSDPRALVPDDSSIPAELLNNTQIQVKTTSADAEDLLGANGAATGVFRLYASLTDGNGPIDPAASRIDFEDWGGQTINLKSGVFSHIILMNDRDGVTPAAPILPDTEITRAQLTYNGMPIINNPLTWALVFDYNRSIVFGGFEDNTAEQLNDVSVPFLPIYTPPLGYSIPALPGGEMPTSQVTFAGSQTEIRVAYRNIIFKSEGMVKAAAHAFGLNGAVQRRMKTATKTDVGRGSMAPDDVARRARMSRLIPGRLGR